MWVLASTDPLGLRPSPHGNPCVAFGIFPTPELQHFCLLRWGSVACITVGSASSFEWCSGSCLQQQRLSFERFPNITPFHGCGWKTPSGPSTCIALRSPTILHHLHGDRSPLFCAVAGATTHLVGLSTPFSLLYTLSHTMKSLDCRVAMSRSFRGDQSQCRNIHGCGVGSALIALPAREEGVVHELRCTLLRFASPCARGCGIDAWFVFFLAFSCLTLSCRQASCRTQRGVSKRLCQHNIPAAIFVTA